MKILPNMKPRVGWKYKWNSLDVTHTITDEDDEKFYFNEFRDSDGKDGQLKEIVYKWFKSGRVYRIK